MRRRASVALDRAKPALRAFAGQVVARFARRGTAELVAEWAKPIPSAGISRVLCLFHHFRGPRLDVVLT